MRKFLAPGEEIKNLSTWQLIKDIVKLVGPYKGRFIVGSLLRLTSDVGNLYSTYAIATMVTIFSRGNIEDSAQQIWLLLFFWAIAVTYKLFSKHFAKVILFGIARQVQVNVESNAIKHMFQLDIAWHEKENTGNKHQRIKNASIGYAQILLMWANNLVAIIVEFVGIIVIIYQFNRPIAIAMAIFLIAFSVVSKFMRNKVGLASNQTNIRGEEISGLQFEAVSNIRTVKIMSMVKTISETLDFRTGRLFEAMKKLIFWSQNRNTVEAITSQAFKTGIMIYIIAGIINGRLEAGLLILFYNYFNTLWGAVEELANVSQDILVARFSISRLKVIMNEPVTIDDETGKLEFPIKWGKIELKNVSFKYGENEVLKNISFTINRGEKIGIIGLSGAGKSTLFKLLLKEYENFEGEILIDDTPIQQISKIDYFNHTAVVLQETEVFNFSLRENIYLAGPGTANKEVELQKALEVAHVTDFLQKLPDGVDTPIGEKGVRLSGGEKQRVGIARAVFKQPQLLLLDEATSHLDLESEEKIQDSLHKFFNTVTAVVIAHRLTTIKEMDKIIVIEDGEILESGNFAELTAKRGRFYELWEKQRL